MGPNFEALLSHGSRTKTKHVASYNMNKPVNQRSYTDIYLPDVSRLLQVHQLL